MKCLDCSKEMTNYEIHTLLQKFAYDICEFCGGLWLDAGELDKMAFQVQGSIEFSSKDGDISIDSKKCPRCPKLPLEKTKFIGSSNIILDYCKNCGGFWLRGGQLEAIDEELSNIMPVSGKGFSEFINKVHLPFWYKRIKRKSSEVDFPIAVPPIKNAKEIGDTSNSCPICRSSLKIYSDYGIQFEACPQCRGLWLNKDNLKELREKSEEESWEKVSWLDNEIDAIGKMSAVATKRVCPKCKNSKLVATHLGNSKIIMDWCPSCHGIWLDQGEFSEIVGYIEKRLEKLTSKDVLQKISQELKGLWNGSSNAKSELIHAKAEVSALINATIFEHPALTKRLWNIQWWGHALGM